MEKWRQVEGCIEETVKEMGAAFKKKFFFFLYSSHRGRVELSESVRSRLKELRPFDFRSFACPILWNSFTLARTVLWDIPFVRCLGFQPCEYIYMYICACFFFVDPFTRMMKSFENWENLMEEFFSYILAFITGNWICVKILELIEVIRIIENCT